MVSNKNKKTSKTIIFSMLKILLKNNFKIYKNIKIIGIKAYNLTRKKQIMAKKIKVF